MRELRNKKIDRSSSLHQDTLVHTWIRQQSVKSKAPVRFGMFGDTNAEKEAKDAQKAWLDALHDPKSSQTTKNRLRKEFEEADKLAEKVKNLKKGIAYVGTAVGGLIGAYVGGIEVRAVAPGPGTVVGRIGLGATTGGALGVVAALPVAHYIAEVNHTIHSKEFKKGYQETRESGELCTIMSQ